MTKEFEEIAHSGGKITFKISTDDEGHVSYQIQWTTNRPVPTALIAVYALPQGIPVAPIQLGGIGQPWNPPPFPGCYPVFVASDSQGMFGHNCPNCNEYWRSGPWPNICPYCGIRAQGYQFLSTAQKRYIRHYCEVLIAALDAGKDDNVVIDMDAVADAIGIEGEKPSFYVSEKSQQRKFTCEACDEVNDILGRFGYCSLCGTRNDLMDFKKHTIPAIRERLNSGVSPDDCLRDAVSSFDSFVAQVAKEIAEMMPMTEKRRTRLTTRRFHDLAEVRSVFNDWFDINPCAGMQMSECDFVSLMFYRRHVYEHNAGEVDQKYLDDSGDSSVRLKQHIHETQEKIHELLGALVKMARNIHKGFQELFPPIPEPIRDFEEKKLRMKEYAKGRS